MSDPLSAPLLAHLVDVPLSAFLALLLLFAAGHKLWRPAAAGRAVIALTRMDAMPNGGLPTRVAVIGAVAAALGETLAAVLILIPAHRVVGAALAVVIWLAYLALLARAVRSGRTLVDCGCSFGAMHRPRGAFQLGRTLGLAVLAAVVGGLARLAAGVAPAVTAAWPATAAIDGSAGLAALTLLVLYGALDQAMSLGPLQTGNSP